jgi:hypothetical protein
VFALESGGGGRPQCRNRFVSKFRKFIFLYYLHFAVVEGERGSDEMANVPLLAAH